MPYRPSTREFWLEVADYKCQYEYYQENFGFVVCGEIARHVHHILGEYETLEEGLNPDENVALPLCENHHVRNIGDTLGEYGSSFHPDMGIAYTEYKEWKRQEMHMNAITGKRRIKYEQSPFADAARGHREAYQEGRRYISGDERTDQYYIDKMRAMAVLYIARTGKKKPSPKPHPLTDTTKNKRWWNHG